MILRLMSRDVKSRRIQSGEKCSKKTHRIYSSLLYIDSALFCPNRRAGSAHHGPGGQGVGHGVDTDGGPQCAAVLIGPGQHHAGHQILDHQQKIGDITLHHREPVQQVLYWKQEAMMVSRIICAGTQRNITVYFY